MFSATKKWVFIKISSVALVPLMLWFILSFVSLYDKNYEQVVLFLTTQPSQLLFSLFIIVVFFYSALSISEIFEDYLHNKEIKNITNIILIISAIILPILTIIMLILLSL